MNLVVQEVEARSQSISRPHRPLELFTRLADRKQTNWIDYSEDRSASTVRPAPAKAPELRLFGMERIAAHVTYKFYREEGRRGNRSRLFSAGQSRGKINLQPD